MSNKSPEQEVPADPAGPLTQPREPRKQGWDHLPPDEQKARERDWRRHTVDTGE